MPVRTFSLTDQASTTIDSYVKALKKTRKKATLGQIVSEAILFYCAYEERGTAEQLFERVVESRLQRFENRLAAMIANVGIDVDMVLFDVLEQREADRPGVSSKQVYQDLRQDGTTLFSRKKAFQAGTLKQAGERDAE